MIAYVSVELVVKTFIVLDVILKVKPRFPLPERKGSYLDFMTPRG